MRRNAFTLMDLLMATGVAGVLMALVVVVIYMQQGRSTKEACGARMQTLVAAASNYEARRKSYPGYVNVLNRRDGQQFTDPKTGQKRGVSFVVPLLLDLDRPDLYRGWTAVVPGPDPGAGATTTVNIDLLTCPAGSADAPNSAPLSYVVNTGMADAAATENMPSDWPDNGVFFDNYLDKSLLGIPGKKIPPMAKMSREFIKRGDGLSQTLLFSENVDAGPYTDDREAKLGFVWNAAGGSINMQTDPPSLAPPDDRMRINRGAGDSRRGGKPGASAIVYARPSSHHGGGVNVAFCDGSCRFINEKIEYYVYCLLMSPNGNRVRTPGTNVPLPGFNRPVNDAWIF